MNSVLQHKATMLKVDEDPRRIHVMPLDDLREHESNMQCWCKPTLDTDESLCAVHHSMDGREAFERGERTTS